MTSVFTLNYDAIKTEFEEQARFGELLADDGLGAPVPCVEAVKRQMGKEKFEATPIGSNQKFCWYAFSKVRTFWPEYAGRADTDLMRELYFAAGDVLPEAHPWTLVLLVVATGIGLPLLVLAFGWAAAGFAGASRKPD